MSSLEVPQQRNEAFHPRFFENRFARTAPARTVLAPGAGWSLYGFAGKTVWESCMSLRRKLW
ncbi:hypothetical protein [Thauera butanivorans]|uniref:hypothetical protein n=1 Tax=Thauera butanivorans TaxID=86174 RepID=UPI0012F86637|nr:hypothetical protein [Thauera butanivorans]